MSVLLDIKAPQVAAVRSAAATLINACRDLNSQVLIPGDNQTHAEVNVLSIALQAVIDGGMVQGISESAVFAGLVVANAGFVRTQDHLPTNEAVSRLANSTLRAVSIGETSPVYDLSAGGHA